MGQGFSVSVVRLTISMGTGSRPASSSSELTLSPAGRAFVMHFQLISAVTDSN